MDAYYGKLVFNDDAQYEVHTNNGYIFNISKALDKVYYSERNVCGVKIIYNGKIVFNNFGLLLKKQHEDRLYDYFIEDRDIEEVLFYLVDANIDIEFRTGNEEDLYEAQVHNS